MKITILQTDTDWASPKANALKANELICSAPGSDLYVLPEMWSSGFMDNPEQCTGHDWEDDVRWMQETACRTKAAICGSLVKKVHGGTGGYANRMYFVRPDSSMETYDKRHLFAWGGENRFFVPGNSRKVVLWKGWRFLLLVCYDLRFPIWSRFNDDYDAIILSANWPETRIGAWDILTRARAIENQCYMVACNRTGKDPNADYNGHSAIIGPLGEIMQKAASGQCAITSDISMEALRNIRMKTNFLNDRDNKQ